MVGNHGFADGNKRTAWLLVEIFLDRSGYDLTVPDDEPIDDMVVAVACGELGFDDLRAWFAANLARS